MNKGEKQVIIFASKVIYVYNRKIIYSEKKRDKQKIVRNLIRVKVNKYKNIFFPIII